MEERLHQVEQANKKLAYEKEELRNQLQRIGETHGMSEELNRQKQSIESLQEAREKMEVEFRDLAAKYKDAKQVILVLEEEVKVLEKEKQEMEQKFLTASMRFDRDIALDPLSSPGKSRPQSKYGQRSTGTKLTL